MLRICISQRNDGKESFFIDNIEKVEVDSSNNLFKEFRIWLKGNIKETSDKLTNFFVSHNPEAWLNSYNDEFVTIHSIQGTFFPYLLSVFFDS